MPFYNKRKGFVQASILEMVTGSITIKYIDENNTEIAARKILNNLSLETYTLSAIEIYDYTLTSEPTVAVTLSKDNLNAVVTFRYAKSSPKKGTVTIKYIDSDNSSSVASDETYSNLKLGSYTYECKILEGYTPPSPPSQTVTITNEALNQEITFKYKKIKGSVTIKYRDIGNNTAIIPDEVNSNLNLGTYSYDGKTFEGYTLASPSPQTVTLTAENPNAEVIFNYNKIKGTVTVFYISNEDNSELAPTEIHANLELGSYTYEGKAFDGYILESPSPQTVILTTANPNTEVVFNYNKIKGTVTVSYINNEDNSELTPTEVHENLELGQYTYTAKVIEGFEVVG